MNFIQSLNGNNKKIYGVLICFLFVIGFWVRFGGIQNPPLDFHVPRQMRAATIARGLSYPYFENVPEWRKEMAVNQLAEEDKLEPSVFETIVALTYRILGQEDLWIARLYSILFWMSAGIPIFLLSRKLIGKNGAFISLLIYTTLPYGVIASRSFQPDILMVMSIVWTLYFLNIWEERQDWLWTVIMGISGGFAVFVKPFAILFIGFPLLASILLNMNWKQVIKNKKILVLAVLMVLPTVIYYVYNLLYTPGFSQAQFGQRFFPEMWIKESFYVNWGKMIGKVLPFGYLSLTLIGTLLIQNKKMFAIMVGLWVGYLLNGFMVPHHISTHDYYSLILIPMCALGMAALADFVFQRLGEISKLKYYAIIVTLLFTSIFGIYTQRRSFVRNDYNEGANFWREIGKSIDPDLSVVAITANYGRPLSYYGWVDVSNWLGYTDAELKQIDDKNFDKVTYFNEELKDYNLFLITEFGVYENYGDLEMFLKNNYSVYKKNPNYIIYDLR